MRAQDGNAMLPERSRH